MSPHLNDSDDSKSSLSVLSRSVSDHDLVAFFDESDNVMDDDDDDDDDEYKFQFESDSYINLKFFTEENSLYTANCHKNLLQNVEGDDVNVNSVASLGSVADKEITCTSEVDVRVRGDNVLTEGKGKYSSSPDDTLNKFTGRTPDLMADSNGALRLLDNFRRKPGLYWSTGIMALLLASYYFSLQNLSSKTLISTRNNDRTILGGGSNTPNLTIGCARHCQRHKKNKAKRKSWKKWKSSYNALVSELHSFHGKLFLFRDLLHEKTGSLTLVTPEIKKPQGNDEKDIVKLMSRTLEEILAFYDESRDFTESGPIPKVNNEDLPLSSSHDNGHRGPVVDDAAVVPDGVMIINKLVGSFYDFVSNLTKTIEFVLPIEQSLTNDQFYDFISNVTKTVEFVLSSKQSSTNYCDTRIPLEHSSMNSKLECNFREKPQKRNEFNDSNHIQVQNKKRDCAKSFEENCETRATDGNDLDQCRYSAALNKNVNIEYSTEKNQDTERDAASRKLRMEEPDSSDLAYIPSILVVDLWKDDPEVVLDGMRELVDILNGNENERYHAIQVIHGEVGGFATFVGALRRWYHHELIQTVGLEFLRLALQTDWSVFQKVARTTETVHVVLAAMNNHQTNEYVQEAGCGALNELSRTSSNYSTKLVTTELKILEATMNAVKLYPSNANIRKYSSKTLYKMSRWDVLHKPIRKAGGIRILKKAFKASCDDEETQRWTRYALRRLDESD